MAGKATAPIHERYQEVIIEKEKHVKNAKMKVEEDNMAKHPDDYNYYFQPSLELSQMVVSKGSRKFPEFLRDVQQWHAQKRKNIQMKSEEKRSEEKRSEEKRREESKKLQQTQINKKMKQVLEV